jgi:signal transduction histidine kinase
MRPRPFLLVPRSIAGQIVLLVVVSVVFFHFAMTAAMMVVTSDEEEPSDGLLTASGFVALVHVLDGLPPESRPAAITAVQHSYPRLRVVLRSPDQIALQPPDNRQFPLLRQALRMDLRVFALAESPGAAAGLDRAVAVQLRDGTIVAAILPLMAPQGPKMSVLVLGTIGFIVLNLAALLWWATRGLTAPLTRFAHAAESFSLDVDPALLPEEDGPKEIRTVSRALNRMRARIRRMVEDRTHMLAAVSHDLRTPITRLRLRAEFIDDDTIRDPMFRDLDQMSRMVHAALSYLRDGEKLQSGSLFELASVAQTICHQFADIGADVRYKGPNQLLVSGRLDELQSAITNLVENAIKFGTHAIVQVRPASPRTVEIDILDDGPGISDAEKAVMLKPFTRGDEARSMNDLAGFGLGLSIARAVAEAHGGELLLLDGQPSGLIARLRLPIRMSRDEASNSAKRSRVA